ncbi:MAG: hypothetical protein HAW59_01640 [Betaproteobacteria bacterium]|nr:hypothetical protein [Betaproteobacteria bacterium]
MNAPAQTAVRLGDEPLRQKLIAEGVPPLAARVLAARNISGRGDIAPKLAELPPPDFLPDIEKFCDLTAAAIGGQKKICVVGDYDADGMCATALAVECLRAMDADVVWRIPDRIRHGYGLHAQIVEEAAADGAALLLTVDNGVSANTAAARAKALGMTVCVTDHHLPPSELPAADCIVNPQLAKTAEGKNLSGVGVAFYAMAALRRRLGANIKMENFLDLVALGTIADCMPMDKLNRTLVGGGLARLRAAPRPGIAALAAEAGRSMKNTGCRDVSHFFAPRINAAGRFCRAEIAVECLLAKTGEAARKPAAEMATLNKDRKKMVAEIMRETEAMNISPPAAVLFDKNWTPGVLGIVAGNVAETHGCPAVVFCRCGDMWRGSGRAPAGWDLYALARAAAAQCGENAVPRFGGHRRAIGVSVRDEESLKAFAAAFTEECRHTVLQDSYCWEVDDLPPPEEVTAESVGYLEKIVWGEEFPRPLFVGDFKISEQRGLNGGHVRMRLGGGGWALPAIAFNRESVGDSERAIFSLSVDKYTGKAAAIVETFL